MTKQMMDIRIKKLALQGLLQRVHGAAEKNGSMPLLRCVLLEAEGGQLQASATDLEVGISSRADLEDNITSGRVAVPVGPLLDIVKRLPDQDVHLQEISGQKLLITSKDTEVHLSCEAAEEFPSVVVRCIDQSLTLEADIYQRLIKACKHAISSNFTKGNLCGINIQFDGQRLTACATDGHRLSLAGVDLPPESILISDNFNHLLSKKALAEIEKLEDWEAQVYIFDNQIAFIQSKITLIIRLLDGEFPDYRRIIPTDHPGFLRFDAPDLLASIDRVRQVQNRKTNAVQLEASGNLITLIAESDTGRARDLVQAEIEGDSLEIGISSNYLADAVSGLGDEIITKYKSGFEPLVFLPQEYGSFDERLELVMPMRL